MFASTLPRPFGLGTGDVPWNHLWSDDIVQPATFTRTQPTRPRTNAHAPRRQSRLLFDLPLFQGLRDRVLLCPGGGRGGMRIKRIGQGNDRTLLDGQGCHSVTQSARHSAGSQNPGLINWRPREYTNTCINTYISASSTAWVNNGLSLICIYRRPPPLANLSVSPDPTPGLSRRIISNQCFIPCINTNLLRLNSLWITNKTGGGKQRRRGGQARRAEGGREEGKERTASRTFP